MIIVNNCGGHSDWVTLTTLLSHNGQCPWTVDRTRVAAVAHKGYSASESGSQSLCPNLTLRVWGLFTTAAYRNSNTLAPATHQTSVTDTNTCLAGFCKPSLPRGPPPQCAVSFPSHSTTLLGVQEWDGPLTTCPRTAECVMPPSRHSSCLLLSEWAHRQHLPSFLQLQNVLGG